MDVYIRIGFLLVGIAALLFVFIDSWYRKRYGRNTEKLAEADFIGDCDPNLFMEDQLGPVRVVSVAEPPVPKFLKIERNIATVRPSPEIKPKKSTTASVKPENLLILSVMAKPQERFASYDLLQTISNTGLQLGEMNIFHYYQNTLNGKIKLFSLASANKPGDFDIHRMGDFSCTGLMLFMNIAEVSDPQHAFKLMLETASQLAEDLDGVLHADPLTPWSEKIAWQYQKKLFNLKTR